MRDKMTKSQAKNMSKATAYYQFLCRLLLHFKLKHKPTASMILSRYFIFSASMAASFAAAFCCLFVEGAFFVFVSKSDSRPGDRPMNKDKQL